MGTDSGIFCSTNGGHAWWEVGLSTRYAPMLSLALSPSYAEDGVLLAGAESCGLFRSHDRGRTGARLGEDVVTDAVNGIVLAAEFPAKADVLVMLGEAMLATRDGGQSWSDCEIACLLNTAWLSWQPHRGLTEVLRCYSCSQKAV